MEANIRLYNFLLGHAPQDPQLLPTSFTYVPSSILRILTVRSNTSKAILSNFSYYPLIWLFCSKTANNDITRTHKRALRILYRDYESTFEELLERDNTKTSHTKNLQKLMIEVYKSLNHLNPEYMWEFFVKKDVQYNLRTEELCKLPSVSSQLYGLNSLSLRGSLLWNTIDDEIQLSPSLEKFKKNIRSWNGISCTCFISN